MNLGRLSFLAILAACGLAGCSKSVSPEAAVNAARVPDANIVQYVNVAKIAGAPFAKHVQAFVEKTKAAQGDDAGMFEGLDAFLAALKAEKLSIADIKSISISAAFTEDSPEPEALAAILLNKPVTAATLKKLLLASPIPFEEEDIVVDGNALRFTKGSAQAVFAANGRVLIVGPEELAQAAVARAASGKRASDLPAVKNLLDDKAARSDLYIVGVPPAELMGSGMLESFIPADGPFGIPQNVVESIQAINGVSFSLNVTDKAAVDLSVSFSDSKSAAAVGEYLSIVAVGMAKTMVYTFTGVNFPVMESLKASASGNTASITCELTAKDLDLILGVME